ncbi:MAG: ATP-binding protein [Deltaproteobacteria bacterium]
MVHPTPTIAPTELLRRLQILMLMRVIFVSLLLGALIFIQIRETHSFLGDIHTARYLLLAMVYFISIIYVFFLRRFGNIILQAYIQLLFDSLFITLFIYATGGIDSIFSFLYILNIFGGSILLYRKGGMIIASSSSILYGLLLDLHYYGVIHPPGAHISASLSTQPAYLFYTIFANMVGFYLVAYLSSYLSEQARRTRFELRAKQVDLDQLEVLKESIINSMNSGLIVLDQHQKIMLFNPAAEKIFNVPSTQALGKSLLSVAPFLDERVLGQYLQDQSSIGRSPYVDVPYREPDRPERYLRLSANPLKYESGEDRGHVLVFQDVTRIREVEEKIKRVEGLAMVGELAAGIAHEIRNPMASISGSIEMLKEGSKFDEMNSRLMNIISREIERLNHLIKDFLGFAKPRETKTGPVNLNELISDSLELIQGSQKWNEKIDVTTDFIHPLEIESDPDQIKQILWNLFLNAVESMKVGGKLYVATSMEQEDRIDGGKCAKIVIRDSGKGFKGAPVSEFFKPFSTTKKEGSGLGLATVKRLTDLLQGDVRGRNHPDGGAEITIRLPLVQSQISLIRRN